VIRTRRTSGRLGRHRLLFVGLGAVVISLSLAACGSSSKSSTATTTGTSATTTGSSATTTGSSTPSGLAAAQALMAKYSVQPTAITSTVKITGTIPKGKTVYFIPCGPNPECQQEGQIVKQAASFVGWNTVIVPNDGTPQGDKAAFDQVVRAKPAGVLYTAIPQSDFQSEIPALEANGTVVSACCVTDAVGNGIDYNIDSPEESAPVGQAQAAIVATDSKCQNADSVIVNLPDFAILADGVKAYKDGMASYCPSSSVGEIDIALADLANANTTIVSYARAHSNVKYVVASTDGVTVGLPAALKAAGLSTKVVGQGATPTNIQYLHAGQEVGDVAFPYNEAMYAMLTAVFQKAAGDAITPSVAPPLWVLTPTNAPNTSAAIFPVVADFQAQYKALWGVG
jgi:ribose transport system substrate-binding protein